MAVGSMLVDRLMNKGANVADDLPGLEENFHKASLEAYLRQLPKQLPPHISSDEEKRNRNPGSSVIPCTIATTSSNTIVQFTTVSTSVYYYLHDLGQKCNCNRCNAWQKREAIRKAWTEWANPVEEEEEEPVTIEKESRLLTIVLNVGYFLISGCYLLLFCAIIGFIHFAAGHEPYTLQEMALRAGLFVTGHWAWSEYRAWSSRRWYKKFLRAFQQDLDDRAPAYWYTPRRQIHTYKSPSALEHFSFWGTVRSRWVPRLDR